MRKLKLQSQLSINGFIAGPNGEMNWMTWQWDEQLKSYTNGITESVDGIVMGKSFAQGFIPHWQNVANDAENPEREFGKKVMNAQKVIFSTTDQGINTTDWSNTRMSEESLVSGIHSLKSETGGNLIAYGGSSFVSSLIKEDLIDEYHLFVNPVALGKGLPIFHQIEGERKLQLESAGGYECGIVVLKYLKK